MEDLRERDKRRNGTSVFNEPYSAEGIERLKSMIKTYQSQERDKYYSILVDNETVVDRNNNFRNFDDYMPFVNDYTRTIEVRMYLGSSPNCNRHIFHKSETSLKGATDFQKTVNIDAEITKALADQQRKFQLELIQKKLRKKDKQIRKLKQKLGESSTGLEGIQDLASKAIEIAGMFKGKQAQLSGPETQDAEVEIEAEQISEEEEIYNDLLNEVGTDGIKKALRVMELLSKHPELEDVLNNELKKGQDED